MTKALCKSPEVALVLQGGGALGAYQVGTYKAMTELGQEPNVVAGISIGAINGAIIAGNTPANRLKRLLAFWEKVGHPASAMFSGNPYFDSMQHVMGVWQAFMLGQPNFFKPRFSNPWLATPGSPEATSFYDTSMLKTLLEELIDFDLLNSGQTRLFLGAVKVTTGDMVFFDSAKTRITADHVMASGALPPAFPAVRIDGDLYWDGGCCSNTVIDVVLENNPHCDKRVFMPTLFSPIGPEPKTMDEVMVRQQDIQYASRSVRHVKRALEKHNLRVELCRARREKGVKVRSVAARQDERNNQLEIIHVIYRSPEFESVRRDTDFSRRSIERRINSGFADMQLAIRDSDWYR